jgi:hypothetical protein
MLEMIGHLTPRWIQWKRQQFIALEASQRITSRSNDNLSTGCSIPRCLTHQESRSQRAFSSLSSSSDDLSNETNSPEADVSPHVPEEGTLMGPTKTNGMDEKSYDCGDQDVTVQESDSDQNMDEHDASKDFHDYNAMPLPDPKISYHTRRGSGTSLSADPPVEAAGDLDSLTSPAVKRRKVDQETSFLHSVLQLAPAKQTPLPIQIAKKGGIVHNIVPKVAKKGGISHNIVPHVDLSDGTVSMTMDSAASVQLVSSTKLPSNIAKKGGISHSIRPVGNSEATPALALPPFTGLGRKRYSAPTTTAAPFLSDVKAMLRSGTASSEASTMDPSVSNDIKCMLGIKTTMSETSSIAPHSVTSYLSDIKNCNSEQVSVSELVSPSHVTSTDVDEFTSSEEGDGYIIRGSYHVNQDSQLLMGDVLMRFPVGHSPNVSCQECCALNSRRGIN